MPSIKKTLEYLYGLERFGITPGLGRIKKILAALGNPQKSFTSFHIAGTNGKGSTSAFLFSILKQAGYSCGLYTSPHLERFNERIRTDKGLIKDPELAALTLKVKDACEKAGINPSFFEFTTALAFEHFRLRKIDVAVIETGMGGRWDATNVITPLVSVITNVGLDHTAWLGDSVEKIAVEKAGIIKKGVPIVTGARGKALAVISKTARQKAAQLYKAGQEFKTVSHGKSFDYDGGGIELKRLSIGLLGPHQPGNAALAITAALKAAEKGMAISPAAIRKGLKEARWPGRLEVLGKRPLVIIDAAHNPEGAKSLACSLKGFRFKRLFLVLGIMSDKDIKGIVRTLAPLAHRIFAASPKLERAARPEALIKAAQRHCKNASAHASVEEACRAALKEARPADLVCVTGSIFTIGEARRYLSKKALVDIQKK